jgi:hypothetical protein
VAVVDPVVSLTLADLNWLPQPAAGRPTAQRRIEKVGFKEVYDYFALHDLYVMETAQLVCSGI